MKKDTIFHLSADELALAKSKNSDMNKLGFAILLKYFQLENHYPKHIKYVDPLMLRTIANQLNISTLAVNQFDWEGRSTKRFRQEIRELLGYRKATLSDISDLKIWLTKNVFNLKLNFNILQQQGDNSDTDQDIIKPATSLIKIWECKISKNNYLSAWKPKTEFSDYKPLGVVFMIGGARSKHREFVLTEPYNRLACIQEKFLVENNQESLKLIWKSRSDFYSQFKHDQLGIWRRVIQSGSVGIQHPTFTVLTQENGILLNKEAKVYSLKKLPNNNVTEPVTISWQGLIPATEFPENIDQEKKSSLPITSPKSLSPTTQKNDEDDSDHDHKEQSPKSLSKKTPFSPLKEDHESKKEFGLGDSDPTFAVHRDEDVDSKTITFHSPKGKINQTGITGLASFMPAPKLDKQKQQEKNSLETTNQGQHRCCIIS